MTVSERAQRPITWAILGILANDKLYYEFATLVMVNQLPRISWTDDHGAFVQQLEQPCPYKAQRILFAEDCG